MTIIACFSSNIFALNYPHLSDIILITAKADKYLWRDRNEKKKDHDSIGNGGIVPDGSGSTRRRLHTAQLHRRDLCYGINIG